MTVKKILSLLMVLCGTLAFAGVKAERIEPLSIGALEGKGQVTNPRFSPDGKELFFELLAADGESSEVYVASVDGSGDFPPLLGAPEAAMPSKKNDVFSLGGPGDNTISEHPAWGASTKRGQTLALAATRKEASRGGSKINFDIFFKAPGKKRFLTEHPENDSEPTFNATGEYLVFASGRSGEGDLYAYSFYADGNPIRRLTFEESGSELYPAWSPNGKSLAFIGHLGGVDHLFFIDDALKLADIKDEGDRRSKARGVTRDLTAGSPDSSLAPAFSPDGKWIAFFVHPKNHPTRSDLYVVNIDEGEPALLAESVIPPTRDGPCWAPDSKGLFVVDESAELMNPIYFVPLDPAEEMSLVDTGTQLNGDLSLRVEGERWVLLFVAQGGGDRDNEKRWRKIYVATVGR
ncbi:MAG: hypothetical protein C0609_11025 [Deltaproteobacteria bacterium]|nr:MAG: hypothetical protein C0609_11025 [Deltaproteobacteria bacterium]